MQAFLMSWVRYSLRIEPMSLISDSDRYTFFSLAPLDLHFFGHVMLIAMNDGIIDRFSETDENIWILIRCYAVLGGDHLY